MSQFIMALKIVKTFVFVVAALALSSNIFCSPQLRAFNAARRWNTNYQMNKTTRGYASTKYFPVTYEWDTEKIVGGQYAQPQQFPFMAVVHKLLGRGMVSQCGGTILSSRWVLTAGHCAAPQRSKFLVVFGITDKTGIGYEFYNGPGVKMLTQKSFVHPEYRVTANDIALLYMPRDIPLGGGIQPIQLAGYDEARQSFAGSTGVVIGWGKDGFKGTGTTKLKYATLPIIPNSVCSMSWSITNNHICTSDGYGQEACQGDSGGPLVIYQNSMPLQVGIVSYGDGSCPSDKPGVFTRVTGFSYWIQMVTGLQF